MEIGCRGWGSRLQVILIRGPCPVSLFAPDVVVPLG